MKILGHQAWYGSEFFPRALRSLTGTKTQTYKNEHHG